jgi:N-acetylglucosamine-6-sulfatase
MKPLMQPAPPARRNRSNARAVAVLAAACACLLISACGAGHDGSGVPHQSQHVPAFAAKLSPTGSRGRPNVVFVLTDDLSMDLLRFMPHVLAMARDGLTFRNYFVSDSLCCPSRASILTGNFPHDTGVFSNFGARGGFQVFYDRHEEQRTFATALQRAGYDTAFMGKYLNGYMQTSRRFAGVASTDVPETYVPPGWTQWDGAGWGYPEFNYTINDNGVVQSFGRQRSDYLTDVLAHKGVSFIASAAQLRRPFFLELATYAPHSPYVPAPRNAKDFPGLSAPRPPSFDVLPKHAPRWLAAHTRLTASQIHAINSAFRRRAQSVQAIDQLIGEVEAALQAHGLSRNTYLVFSSDNGLHTGEYRLSPGKLTAFDTDIHVPLIVVGPHVPAGTTTDKMAENIDLAKTFAGIGGVTLPGDGRSLLPLLRGKAAPAWRDAILVEHRGPRLSINDPDFQRQASGDPPSYEAMRTAAFLYVEYVDGEREFYDLRTDPFELHNLADKLTRQHRALLHRQLRALERCHGARACWQAMHVDAGTHPA